MRELEYCIYWFWMLKKQKRPVPSNICFQEIIYNLNQKAFCLLLAQYHILVMFVACMDILQYILTL